MSNFTWSDISPALQKTALYTSAARDALMAFGLTPTCSPEEYVKEVQNIFEKFKDELIDVFNTLVSKIGGEFLMAVAMLIANTLIEEFSDVLDSVLGDFIFGNLLGSFYGAIALFFSLTAGTEIFLKYLVVKMMDQYLARRQAVIISANEAVINILSYLQSLQNILNSRKLESNYSNLKKAYKAIGLAQRIIGQEINKQVNPDFEKTTGLNTRELEQADRFIQQAVDFILRDSGGRTIGIIDSIITEYKLTTPKPRSSFDLISWSKYFAALLQEIYEKFFLTGNKAVYSALVNKLLVLLPDALLVIVMQDVFSESIKFLFEKIPLFSNALFEPLSFFGKDGDVDKFRKLVSKQFNISSKPITLYNPYPKDTLQSTTNGVRLQETLFLAYPSYWKIIQKASNVYLDTLHSSIEILGSVRADIKDSIDNKVDLNSWSFYSKKIDWTVQLGMARNYLKPIIGSNTGFGLTEQFNNENLSPAEFTELVATVGPHIDRLSLFINSKYWDSVKNIPKAEPIEKANEIAQKALLPLYANIGLIFSQRNITQVVAQLQAIRTLLVKQLNSDKEERFFTRSVINSMEGHPSFHKLKAVIDRFLNAVGASNKFLSGTLANGDISGIVAFFQTVDTANDIHNLFSCEEGSNTGVYDSILSTLRFDQVKNLGAEELKQMEKDITIQVNTLKDKRTMLSDAITSMSEVTETITAAVSTPFTSDTLGDDLFELEQD